MSTYSTKQRKILLSFLEEHIDEPMSVQQIADGLQTQNISLSAVYRNLSDLEANGKVRRSAKGGTREIFYQYTDVADCRGCLHLSCTHCGKIFHMTDKSAKVLAANLVSSEKFVLNTTDTILYGICESCKNA